MRRDSTLLPLLLLGLLLCLLLLQIKFKCKRCGATTIKPVNPHAWATGTVFAKCGCCQVGVEGWGGDALAVGLGLHLVA